MSRLVLARFLPIAALTSLVVLACSGCGEGSPAGGTGGGSDTGTETSTAPQAPVLDDVMAMNGSLHVSWTVVGASDTIEADRKTSMDPWGASFSVAGTEKSHVDASATADMTYTYRLRCKKGDALSSYSNEKSANPKKM